LPILQLWTILFGFGRILNISIRLMTLFSMMIHWWSWKGVVLEVNILRS